MHAETGISDHYESGDLLDRLRQALRNDGVNPDHPAIADLAPYDHFHGRGLEATEELASALSVSAADHLLDIGSGIGGPARYVADRFGCHVTGIDLTEEFCEVARHLTDKVGLGGKVTFENGNALAMPFKDAVFDGAYSMNVSMNIADKAAFYREIHRVLKPGGWLVLSELARGPGPDLTYPTPWASAARASFLATIEDTRAALQECGFSITDLRETAEQVLAFGARSRALVERGEKPPHRAVQLIHGDIAKPAMANVAQGVAQASIIPVEIFCRRNT